MKAVVLEGPERLTVRDIPTPKPQRGEVLMRVECALTCGTDLKVYLRGGHPRMIKVPSVFGHEMAGIVEETGEGVDGFPPGTRVVPANSAPCGGCYYCTRGMPNLCDDMVYLNGAYAEYVLIPERIVRYNLLRIPDEIPMHLAALSEPLACAMHGVDVAGCTSGDEVLLCGAGPLGLMLLAVMSRMGVRVTVCEPSETRRAAALRMGAHAAVEPPPGGMAEVAREFSPEGRGFDIAIDATGKVEVWHECIDAVRGGGTVVFFGGTPPGTTLLVDTTRLHYEQLTLKGVYHHTPEYTRGAMNFIRQNGTMLEEIVSIKMPLERVEDALVMMKERRILKACITPKGSGNG